MRFRILGPLEVQTGADWTSIGAPKWRAVLARLLLAAGQIVPTDTLIDEVWGDDPPARASNMISIYVLRLRRFIGDHEGRLLRTQAPGYQLRIGPDDLDTQQFTALLRQGQQALAGGTTGDRRPAAHRGGGAVAGQRPGRRPARRPSSRRRPSGWTSCG